MAPDKHVVEQKETPVLHKNIARVSFLVYLTIMGAVATRAQETPATTPSVPPAVAAGGSGDERSEEHTSELQSRLHLVCRLLLEKKKKTHKNIIINSL